MKIFSQPAIVSLTIAEVKAALQAQYSLPADYKLNIFSDDDGSGYNLAPGDEVQKPYLTIKRNTPPSC